MKRKAIAVCLLAVAAQGTAHAQESPRDPAQAEALFQAGLALLKSDDWKGACPKFAQSMKLDSSVGALLNVGRCQEHEGRLASAWATYTSARALNMSGGVPRNDQVDEFLGGRIAALSPRLPRLVVRAADRPAGLEVRRGDVPIASESFDVPMPVDPGLHEITASAPGYVPFHRQIEARESSTATVDVALVLAPPEAKPTPAPLLPRPPPKKSSFGTRATIGVATGGAGLVSLAVSAVTGALALDAHGALSNLDTSGACTIVGVHGAQRRLCDAGSLEDARAQQSRGSSLAVVSTATLLAGTALTAVGATLVFTDRGDRPSAKPRVTPYVHASGAGLGFGGRF